MNPLESDEQITRFRLDPANPPRLTAEEAARLDAMTEDDIDLSDIPELPDDFFKKEAQR